jgi:hypothetical protein
MEKLTIKQKLSLRRLKDNGIVKVEIHYSGGGDDGCIDNADGYVLDENGKETWKRNCVPDEFLNTFDELFYELLNDDIEWDWVNNDGGYGYIELVVDTGQMAIRHTQRHTEEYSYDVNDEFQDEILNALKDGSPVTS